MNLSTAVLKHAEPSTQVCPAYPILLLLDAKQTPDTVMTNKRCTGQQGIPEVQPEHCTMPDNLWGIEHCVAHSKQQATNTFTAELCVASGRACTAPGHQKTLTKTHIHSFVA
jgi:hypothetical protein